MIQEKNKKAVTAVVATALVIVVAVVSVIGFQSWFGSFSSKTFVNVEQNSDQTDSNSQIETLVGDELYFKNNLEENLSITEIKVNGKVCNISISNLSLGVESISLENCTNNLTTNIADVTIVTDKQIFNKKIFLKDVGIVETENVVVLKNYSKVVLEDNPIAYWQLDETSGVNAIERINGYDGTYQNSPLLQQSGLASSSEYSVFMSKNNMNSVRGNANIPAFNLQEVTIEAWIDINNMSHTNAIFHNGDLGVGLQQGYVVYIGTDKKLTLRTFDDPTWIYLRSNNTLSENTMYHVVVTHSGSVDNAKFYINGQLDMIRSYSGGICTTNQRYWIGRIQVGNGYPQANAEFDGYIDEVAIYNKILTDQEVLEHYNEGK